MSKPILFGGIDVQVAVFKNAAYLNSTDVSKAVGYKSSIPDLDGQYIELGRHRYYSLNDMERALSKATGDRGRMAKALLAEVRESYGGQELMPFDPSDVAVQWLTARSEVRTAKVLLDEAIAREAELKSIVINEVN